MTSFNTTNSAFVITDENNTFTDSKPSYWSPQNGEERITQQNKILELRTKKDIDLNVKEVEEGSTRIEIENSG